MHVGVCDRYQPGLEGAHSLVERAHPQTGETIPPVTSMEVVPLEEAMTRQWDFDAHFTLYQVEEETKFPRILKAGAQWLAAQGAILSCSFLAVDIDNNPHVPWYDVGYAQQQALLEKIVEVPLDTLLKFRWLYFSSKGARLVYQLDRPVDIDRAEDHLRWLTDQWIRAGFSSNDPWQVDRLCDWTRLFRLPSVTRDGKETWKAKYWRETMDNHLEVSVDELGRMDLASHGLRSKAAASPVDEDQPTPEECYEMLWTGAQKPTDWHKSAKRRLKGRECYPFLFEDEKLRDNRDTSLTRMIGQACSLLFNLEQCSARRIFALFYELAATLEPDAGTPDWFNSVWGKIKRFYGQELARQTEKVEKHAEQVLEAEKTVGDSIVAGARNWVNPQESRAVFGDCGTALKYLSRRMIANCGSMYMLMGTDGRYENLPLKKDQIIPRLRVNGMEPYIPTVRHTDDGEKDLNPSTLINRHATLVKEIIGVAGTHPGGVIHQLDTPEATLEMSLYCRNPNLTPLFDPDVDAWLHILFGAKYDVAEQWIGHALAFDEGPVCAISITGDPGAGKKMFVEGLAETLLRPALATADDLVGDWGYGLFNSPFLVINEGWPKRTRYAKAPMDAFRTAVGGDGLPACRKSEAPVQIRVPLRVIFTANNLDAVKELAYGKTLAPEDRLAIEDRLIHIDVGSRASTWLAAKGGRDFTGAAGRRWIRGDGGGGSDYIVARHFLWIYENRRIKVPGRFLLSGERNSQIMKEMRQEGGVLPIVGETLITMIERFNFDRPFNAPPTGDGMDGICIDQDRGKVWATSGGLQQAYRKSSLAKTTREDLTLHEIGVAFRTLAANRAANSYAPMRGVRKSRWHEIDLYLLAEMMDTYGWGSTRIQDLLENRKIIENSITTERILDA